MSTLRPLRDFAVDRRRAVRFVLTDIDDTLTLEGRLPAAAYGAMERLHASGFKVIPITGRPAGWCDHIARMWPVDGVVGENGAFWFHYDDRARRMTRCYWTDEAGRAADRERLTRLRDDILAAVPGAAVAGDQAYREADLAIDFCEDIPALPTAEVDRIVAMFEAAGARAKVSSIHVNGWFGDFDKLAMTRRLFTERFGLDIDDPEVRDSIVYAGDSPNDAPMFGFFPNAVGVANVRDFVGRLDAEPRWITEARGGYGFAELADALLDVQVP